jgi:hypothetical protein
VLQGGLVLCTRSKAAIFCRLTVVSRTATSAFSGRYFATSNVGAESSLGALSAQVVRSLAFCEVGVKKFATALSVQASQQSQRRKSNGAS